MQNRLAISVGAALICAAVGASASQAQAATPQSATPRLVSQRAIPAQQMMPTSDMQLGAAYPGDTPSDSVSANQRPAPRELLQKCKKGKNCKFHPAGPPKNFLGKRRKVSGIFNNCHNNVKGHSSLSYSQTTGQSNSYGVSLGVQAGYAEVFMVTFTASYDHTWETSKTVSSSADITVPGHHKAWWIRAAPMHRWKGIYEMHFANRFYGHYIWYLPFTATGPNENGGHGVLLPRVVKCKK